MKKLFFLVLFFNTLCLYSQTDLWYHTRGNLSIDDSWAVNVDAGGNIYWVAEHKNPPPWGYWDIYLYKLDQDGQQLWISNPCGGVLNDGGLTVRTSGDYVYVAGNTYTNILDIQKTDPQVICYDKYTGATIWDSVYPPSPNYGYEEIDGISIQPEGIYLTGWTQGSILNDMNALVQKISLTGQPVWTNPWDFGNLQRYDGANGQLVMDNEHMYIAAHVNKTWEYSNDGDAALVCFDRTDGSYLWHTLWGGSSWDHGLGLTMSTDSMLYMVGHTGSYGSLQQFFINKYNRSGQLIWSRLWGGAGADLSRSVVTDGDSIIYAAGTTTSYGNGSSDMFVLKYDSAGTLLDSLFWGGSRKEICRDLSIYNGYLFLAGITESFHSVPADTASDALLIKINGRTMQAPDTTMTGISETFLNTQNKVEIYPNPADDAVYIKLNTKTEIKEISLFNAMGKNVFHHAGIKSDACKLNTAILPAGFYVIKITDKENKMHTGKVLIR